MSSRLLSRCVVGCVVGMNFDVGVGPRRWPFKYGYFYEGLLISILGVIINNCEKNDRSTWKRRIISKL